MAGVMNISTIEELQQFINEKGVMEIIIRDKAKKYKVFQKVAIDKLQQTEAMEQVKEAIAILNKNTQIAEKGMVALQGVASLGKFNLILNGLNLCATCVGFAIMFKELEAISSQIEQVITVYKEGQGIQLNYTFEKVRAEHANMLDCRKKQKYYSEDKMRELISEENAVLGYLIDVFKKDMSNTPEIIIYSMLSLASMLAVSIKYFDELYYFSNKDTIKDGDLWHTDHSIWEQTYTAMTTEDIIKKVQDCGFFDLGLNAVENDYFYISFTDQIRSLKRDIEDNQKLIVSIDDSELFKALTEKTNEEILSEIESAFKEAGADIGLCEDALRVAVA